MYAEERRLHILDLLRKKKRVDVADLADQLDASPETIRRDLNEMEADGFLKRTHGGAIYLGDQKYRPLLSAQSRRDVNHEKKMAIARVAAAFIDDGDVVAIDNSTTACCLVGFIRPDIKLTIITYSLQVVAEALAVADNRWTIIDLGGIVHQDNMSVHGLLTSDALAHFQPRKLFMSCAGIGPDGLLTEGALIDTEIKRELIRCCKKRYLLVDDSKWGQTGAVNEGNIADMDCVVTNASTDPARIAGFADRGVEIVLDSPPG